MTSAPATPTSAAAWPLVRALFDRLALLDAAAREAALRAEPDVAVAAEVRALLAHHDDGTGAGLDAGPLASLAAEPSRTGERLGAWRIGTRLGSGGMGEVWLADRADGHFEAQAAIKLLKPGMDSAAVLTRFAQEQQALARLAHPHIARLLDAGRSADGRPYFVMERVDGVPIDRACEGRTLEQRLALFLQLADAVSHAHRHLLVHRDLKPGNVLVDGEGQVKLLDFGIAKALDPLEGGDPGVTQAGERPFTPHYASPEQVRGEPVSTATDLYSLGVLLYVMLTGQRPYGREARTPHEAARSVLEEQPTRPSSLPDAPGADTQWQRTRRRLQGDLDKVLLKALDKLVDGRYATVDAMAADIRAYLAGYPVSARPTGWAERARKAIARNRLASGAAALAVFSLVAGAGGASWQATVAARERSVAERRFAEVRQLAGQLVFKYHDQLANLQGAAPVREALLVDAATFLDSLRGAAQDDPALAQDLAGTYYRIAWLQGLSQNVNTGQHDKAKASLDQAIVLHPLYLDHPSTSVQAVSDAIDMLASRAEVYQREGRIAAALPQAARASALALALAERHPKDFDARTSAVGAGLIEARILGTSLGYANAGRLSQAWITLERTERIAREMLEPSPNNVESLNTLAVVLGERANWLALNGRPDDAAAVFAEQIAIRDRNAQSKPDDAGFRAQRIVVRGNLAAALAQAGRHAEARARMDEAAALAAEMAAADPGNAAAAQRVQTLRVLDARQHALAGDLAGARRLSDAVLPGVPATSDFSGRRWRAEALVWGARAWRATDPARALALADEATSLMQADDDNAARQWMVALALGERALALAAAKSTDAASAAAQQALATWAAAPGDGAGGGAGRVPGAFAAYRQALNSLLP